MSDARDGWAVRREGRCLEYERGHNTWDDWFACCPETLSSDVDSHNNARCVSDHPPDVFPTQCANASLVLWSDSAGYFCCESDLLGFKNQHSFKGCATQEVVNEGVSNKSMKVDYQEGKSPASTISSASSTSSATSTSTQSSTSSTSSGSSGSSTDKGAIAGGVVGGFCGALILVGIIWFLRRRRSPSAPSKSELAFPSSTQPSMQTTQPGGNGNSSSELYGLSARELPGSTQPQHELPGSKNPTVNQHPPSELS